MARGMVYGGYFNGSTSIIESVRQYYNPTHTLTVNKAGTGSKTVTSSPVGINCRISCSADFPTSTLVTLTAIEDSTFVFAGFSCDCNSQGEVLMDGNKNCVATFNLRPPSEVGGSSNPITISKGSGTSVVINYTPANCSLDHSVYWGQGAIAGALDWTNNVCSIGKSGSATIDPGDPPPSSFYYFVSVGNNGIEEGSYGKESSNT